MSCKWSQCQTTKIIKVLVFTIVILALTSFKMYYVRDDGGVDIVWNKSEGYLFLSVVRRGYHFSYLEYPMDAMLQYFGSIRLPDDHHSSITVLQVTPSTVQRYVTENIPPLIFYTPFDQTIYANREGVLWKWAGARFEQATAEEQRKVDGTNRLIAQAFTDVHGPGGPPFLHHAYNRGCPVLAFFARAGQCRLIGTGNGR
jgi:hypothetical protein